MLARRLRAAAGVAVTKAIDFLAVGAVNSGASPTVDIPTGIATGDLLVLCVASGGDTTTPSGWTLIAASGSGTTRIATFYRISDGSETDFTLGNTQSRTQCGVIAYRPTGGSASYVSNAANTGLSTTAATATQSITAVPAVIVSHFIKDPNATDIGTVSGTNQRLLGDSNGTYTNLRVVDEFPSTTGTSTSRSEAASYSATWRTNAALFIVS